MCVLLILIFFFKKKAVFLRFECNYLIWDEAFCYLGPWKYTQSHSSGAKGEGAIRVTQLLWIEKETAAEWPPQSCHCQDSMLEPLEDRSSLEAEIWNNLREVDEFSGSLVSVNVCSSKDVPGSVIPSHLHWCLITAIHQVLSKFDICNSAWVVLLPWQTGKCVFQPLRALSQWPMVKYFVALQYLSQTAKIWLLGVLFVLVLL